MENSLTFWLRLFYRKHKINNFHFALSARPVLRGTRTKSRGKMLQGRIINNIYIFYLCMIKANSVSLSVSVLGPPVGRLPDSRQSRQVCSIQEEEMTSALCNVQTYFNTHQVRAARLETTWLVRSSEKSSLQSPVAELVLDTFSGHQLLPFPTTMTAIILKSQNFILFILMTIVIGHNQQHIILWICTPSLYLVLLYVHSEAKYVKFRMVLNYKGRPFKYILHLTFYFCTVNHKHGNTAIL
jgi:hypothetical protein